MSTANRAEKWGAVADAATGKGDWGEAVTILKSLDGRLEKVEKAYQSIPDLGLSGVNGLTTAPRDDAGRHGFKSLGHFLHDVRKMAQSGPQDTTPVFKAWQGYVEKAASGVNELVGSEGAFLVPPTFSSEILRRTYDNDLLSRTKPYTTSGNDMSIPAIDETSRANGSRFGGVQMYWDAEASQYQATKPAWSRVELKLKKLTGLVHVTDEMIADTGTAMEGHLFDLFSEETAFKMGDAIVNGSGAGMPQGVLNSLALVTVSKETGQAAASLLFENINKMWQRMYAPSRKNAIWLVNQDIEAALDGLAITIGTGGFPAYMPPGGLSEKPYATLKGRPVMPVEFCATLGTVGDILLLDLSQYLTLRKGEAQQASSIHFKFDTGEQSFRITFRADGRGWWQNSLTPYKGANTLSPFIALETRA
jgi:HK97 family phage major capsid protein